METDVVVNRPVDGDIGGVPQVVSRGLGSGICVGNRAVEAVQGGATEGADGPGGDTFAARRAYSAEIEHIRAEFVPFVSTNQLPVATDGDEAFWRRVLVGSFEQRFLADPDPTDPKQHGRTR